jgi:hypothetical protein
LFRPLALFQRTPRQPSWPIELQQIIEDLERLNQSTEQDFLSIGEKLMGFRSTARQVAADTLALTDLISGKQGRNASDALTRMLDHSKELDARIERSGQALVQVHALSSRIRQGFGGLRNTVSVFRTLCTLTRIETSRLGNTGADFGDLAAEVIPLSELIQSSGEGVLEASAMLDTGVQAAMHSGSDLQVRQLRDLPALIAGVLQGLDAFEERRRRAAELSILQAAQYRDLCDAIDGVVTELQFHDITRQQVEHVIDALRDLRDGNSDSRMILALQSAQLSSTSATFASSIERMERDLDHFATRVQEMTEATRALMGMSSGDHDSFFLQMEGHFNDILKLLASCGETESEINAAAASLGSTIGGMCQSVHKIREIEISIQRISINATLRATQIGAGGDPLSVIAAVMLRLATESNLNTESAADALDEMKGAADRAAGSRSETRELAGEIRGAIAELHGASESSFSRVNEIADLGAQLAAEIGPVREGFYAGRLFDQVVTRARAQLERLHAQVPQGVSKGTGLDRLARQYSMQTERDVHESIVQGAEFAVLAVVPSTAQADGDLGDNVELF